ncbi:RNA polymerase beta subunit [Vibrio phage vB_VpaM_sm033]|nr:RNA polymerase beta subunit [Vibrio phage vB_VpaM_sm033]
MLVEKHHTCSSAIGITEAITSFERFNSASRTAMAASQAAQYVVPADGPDCPRILTTYEAEQAKYTMGITMPVDGITKAMISKYQIGSGMNSVRKNAERTLMYIDQDSGKLDCLEIKSNECTHDIFGYELHDNTILRHAVREGVPIPKGTKLTSSKGVLANGLYSSVLTANYCYLSVAPVIEDGMWVSEELVERSRPYAYAKVTFEWGKTHYPLDMYGDGTTYKPFVGPGEKIKPSGLVAALREKNDIYDAVMMLPQHLTEVHTYDKSIYAPPESEDVEVCDVSVLTTTRDHNRLPLTPVGMEVYPRIFAEQRSKFLDRVLDVYEDFRRETGYRGEISPRMSALLVEAYSDKPTDPRCRMMGAKKQGGITRTMRGTPIDEWHIELKLKWKFRVGNGGKLTNLHGSKGVFARIVPKEHMPVDQYGRRAEVVIYGGSTIARLNDGQLYEQFANCCGDTVAIKCQEMIKAGQAAQAWEFLLGWYAIASPETLSFIQHYRGNDQVKHMNLIAEHGTCLAIEGDNTYVGVDWARKMMAYCPPIMTPVTYTNLDGKKVTTKAPVMIGAASWWLLDKTSTKPMAVSVARRQIHGIPSTVNKSTKNAAPTNLQPSRTYAESEIRGITYAVNGKHVMDVVDLSVNPEALDGALVKLWNADKPTAECGLINRAEVPYGTGRSVSFPRHILECLGPTVVRAKGRS